MKQVLAILLFFLMVTPALAADQKESTYDSVMRTNTLRCGYVVWPPEFSKDPNTGKMSGMAYDIVMELARRLSLKIEWTEEVNFGNMIEGLNQDRYNMVCFTSYRESNHMRFVNFSNPVYYTGSGVFVRADDARFDGRDYAVFNDPKIIISTMDGEMSAIIADDQFPKAKTTALPQNSDFASLLLNVANGKADVTFADIAAARKFMMENPGQLKDISAGNPIRLWSHGFIYKKGDYDWSQTVNLVLAEMQEQGFTGRVLTKYKDYQGAFLPVAKPYEASK